MSLAAPPLSVTVVQAIYICSWCLFVVFLFRFCLQSVKSGCNANICVWYCVAGSSMTEHHDRSCAGMIATKCCPSQVVGDAVMDARSICMREYASAPEVNIYGDPNFTFPYVPSHLHHMTFELVKNSLRAVNDKYDDSDDEPPPIRLVVAEGEEDITIKVNRLLRCTAQQGSCSRAARAGMSVSTQGMPMCVFHIVGLGQHAHLQGSWSHFAVPETHHKTFQIITAGSAMMHHLCML